jgi:hypothetical protein
LARQIVARQLQTGAGGGQLSLQHLEFIVPLALVQIGQLRLALLQSGLGGGQIAELGFGFQAD